MRPARQVRGHRHGGAGPGSVEPAGAAPPAIACRCLLIGRRPIAADSSSPQQIEYGDHNPEKHTAGFLRNELVKYIPQHLYDLQKPAPKKEKDKKGKKGKEPAPAKKKEGGDDDEEEEPEDLLGDNEWAKTNEADFSNAVDDMFLQPEVWEKNFVGTHTKMKGFTELMSKQVGPATA